MSIDYNQKFHIVWYYPHYIDLFGGSERVMLEGARCFGKFGGRTTVLLHEPMSSKTAAFFKSRNLQIAVLPSFSIEETVGLRWFERPRQFVRRVLSLRETIKSLAPDIIIANEFPYCRFLWIYSLMGLLPLPPVVTFIHGSSFQFVDDLTKYALIFRRHLQEIRERDPVYKELIPNELPSISLKQRIRLELESLILWVSVKACKTVFVLSNKNRKEVELLYGISNIKVVSPGGYSSEELLKRYNLPVSSTGAPILLSMCRLIKKKRVDLLIDAFRVFLDQYSRQGGTLIIGGTGPEDDSLKAKVDYLGLQNHVRLVGFIPESELGNWYKASDVFLSADNADYDLSVMMGLFHGRKVVVTTQYDIPPEISSLRRFFFTSTSDAASLGQMIAKALGTPVSSISDDDVSELQLLTWESYFSQVLQGSGLLIPREGATH